MNKVLEKQTYNQELTELTDKFLSISTPKKQRNRKKADLADPEKTASELRSLYSDMPPYCVYPDCFHCPYGDCGWTKAGNEESIQELIRVFARKRK